MSEFIEAILQPRWVTLQQICADTKQFCMQTSPKMWKGERLLRKLRRPWRKVDLQ